MSNITLPVSLGEALDKLTILDIKLQKIKDSRRNDVEVEYAALLSYLKPYVDAYPYHYRVLKEINLNLWNIQDEFHGKDIKPEDAAYCAHVILQENDRRFRIKLKINTLASSTLKEQKGYAAKKALFYGHLGLGDMFWMNGAVRYLATAFDEVYVICKRRNEKNAAAMYADDPSIRLIVIDNNAEDNPNYMVSLINWYIGNDYSYISCGFFAQKEEPQIYDLPNSFYDDIQMPRSIRNSYFHVPRTDASKALRALYGDRSYVVVHEQSSVQTLLICDQLLKSGETRLILNVNRNIYNPLTHPEEYALAQHVVGVPLLDYVDLLEGAEELHLIESSFYCLASHLDLTKATRRVCYEPWGGNAERLGVFTTGFAPAAAALTAAAPTAAAPAAPPATDKTIQSH